MRYKTELFESAVHPCDFTPKYCCAACTHFRKCAPGAKMLKSGVPVVSRRKSRNSRRYRRTENPKGLCLIMRIPDSPGSSVRKTV